MKQQRKKGISVAVATAVLLAACKTTDWSKVKYEVNPSPLELKGDSVEVNVKGTIPPNVFKPNTSVVLTPAIKWNGGQKELTPISFYGEKVKGGTGTKVSKSQGETFTYKTKVAYLPEMKVSELGGVASITKKKKTKQYTLPKIADGVITTPLLVIKDEKAILDKENLKAVTAAYTADIHFVISQDDVRPIEIKKDDVQKMLQSIKNAAQQGYVFKKAEISAYASPDGEQNMNENLAEDRANSVAQFLVNEMKKQKIEAASKPEFYNKTWVAEDWEGFKSKMEASAVPDKEMILRILSTYTDLDRREQEIKNISEAYSEIKDQILPELRRAKISFYVEEKMKTDEEIAQLAEANPQALTVEELLHAAALTNDINKKMSIYQSISQIYPTDWRGPNNVGSLYLMQNKLNEAEDQFEKADKLDPNNQIVLTNLGAVAMKKGDVKTAEKHYNAAKKATSKNVVSTTVTEESSQNLGNLYIRKGNYPAAVASFGNTNSFNAALAKLLNKDYDGALKTLDASKDKDSAIGYYLRAIIGARKGDAAMVNTNLKNAVQKDASLKEVARADIEFLQFKDNSDFKSIIG